MKTGSIAGPSKAPRIESAQVSKPSQDKNSSQKSSNLSQVRKQLSQTEIEEIIIDD